MFVSITNKINICSKLHRVGAAVKRNISWWRKKALMFDVVYIILPTRTVSVFFSQMPHIMQTVENVSHEHGACRSESNK